MLVQYLEAVFRVDAEAVREYQGQMVMLYAEFNRAGLLPFLRKSQYVPLQDALALCRERELVDEVVFLLGRMGRTREALQVLLSSRNCTLVYLSQFFFLIARINVFLEL